MDTPDELLRIAAECILSAGTQDAKVRRVLWASNTWRHVVSTARQLQKSPTINEHAQASHQAAIESIVEKLKRGTPAPQDHSVLKNDMEAFAIICRAMPHDEKAIAWIVARSEQLLTTALETKLTGCLYNRRHEADP